MYTGYLPRTDEGKTPWVDNFNSKLQGYSAKYNISPTEISDVASIKEDWVYRMGAITKVQAYSQAITKWKNYLRDGAPEGAMVTMPQPPTFGEAPATPAASGGFKRIAAIIKKIKDNSQYSEADGKDLGIIGAEAPAVDMDTMKPEVQMKQGPGGKPKIVWTLGMMDGVAVYKDKGDGAGFQFYDFDNHPDYDDKAPLPATATTWRYKLIYRLNDEEVGQFSDVVTVHVGQ